jgi:hypothetical protein
VHGQATLSVAIDGDQLLLDFDSPMENLVGFEHAPRNEQQKQALLDLKSRLDRAAAIFLATADAGCTQISAKLDSPLLGRNVGDKEDGNAHADLSAEYEFRCREPLKLRDIEVRLFQVFPRLQGITVSIAGPKGQAEVRLTPKRTRIPL